jgi:uncharacterized membrane protein
VMVFSDKCDVRIALMECGRSRVSVAIVIVGVLLVSRCKIRVLCEDQRVSSRMQLARKEM